MRLEISVFFFNLYPFVAKQDPKWFEFLRIVVKSFFFFYDFYDCIFRFAFFDSLSLSFAHSLSLSLSLSISLSLSLLGLLTCIINNIYNYFDIVSYITLESVVSDGNRRPNSRLSSSACGTLDRFIKFLFLE